MNRTQLGTLLVAASLLLAGCAGGIGGGTPAGGTDGDGDTASSTDRATMHFYVSDRPGDIEDFEHLNVTVTSVTLFQAEDGDAAGDDTATATPTAEDTATDGDESDETTENETTTETTKTAEPEDGAAVDADASADADVDADEAEAEAAAEAEAEAEMDDREDESEDEDDDGDTTKQTYDVEPTTVDLTDLRGANASLVDTLNVSAGTYERVVLHVSETDGTLTDGSTVNVKLPSNKLQLNKEFTVAAGDDTAFVFDVMVHEAGNSGKYVLRPVVAESGTGAQVDIKDVAGTAVPGGNGSAGVGDDDADDADDDANLTATFQGTVEANATVTVLVTDADGPVENATVTLDGEVVGTTGENGTVAVDVGAVEELELEVTKGDAEAELETELGVDAGADDEEHDGGADNTTATA